MKIRTRFLLLGSLVMLSAGILFSADETITLENVVDPGPNRPDEPYREEFSFSAAVRFMDSAALTWQKKQQCFACHSNYDLPTCTIGQ